MNNHLIQPFKFNKTKQKLNSNEKQKPFNFIPTKENCQFEEKPFIVIQILGFFNCRCKMYGIIP